MLLAAQAAPAPREPAGVDPASLVKPLAESWPTYSGDYTGRRFSALTQVNRTTVKNLTLAWVSRVASGPGPGGRRPCPGVPRRSSSAGTALVRLSLVPPSIKGSILQVDGILYVTAPDHVWAIDARDGRELWRYFWKTRGGTHIGNRGAAIWQQLPVLRDAGQLSRRRSTRRPARSAGTSRSPTSTSSISRPRRRSSSTTTCWSAPATISTCRDSCSRSMRKPVSVQWKFYTVPMKPGDPGLDTWPSLEAARHGGGQVWVPGVYDPETRLYIFGTGNPTPAYTGVARKGDNLFTCSLIAVNVDTGKMAWYFQTSAHDTHDWDSAQTPILIDGTINGRPRKLVSTASRNGYFYTLDRVDRRTPRDEQVRHGHQLGQGASADRRGRAQSRQVGDDSRGARVAGRGRRHQLAAGRVLAANRAVLRARAQRLQHPLPERSGSARLDGARRQDASPMSARRRVPDGDRLQDRQGRLAAPVSRERRRAAAVLATAGDLVFTGDAGGNFVALDARNGKPLWHSRIGSISNAPQTYLIDGHQYVLVATSDTIWAFTLDLSVPGRAHV